MNQIGIPNLDKKLEASLIADMVKVEELMRSHIQGDYPLVVVGVLASAIAAFFYIRVIIMMFFTDPVNDSVSVIIPSVKSKISISASLLISLVLGIAPSLLLTTAGNYANFIR